MVCKSSLPWRNVSRIRVFSGRRPACDLDAMPPGYSALLQQCWATKPAERPSFAEIIPRVRDMIRDERAKRPHADSPAAAPAGGAAAPPPSRDGSAPATGASSVVRAEAGLTVRDAAHVLHQGDAQSRAGSLGSHAPDTPVPHCGPGRPAGVGPGLGSGSEPRADPDAVTMAAASPVFVEPHSGSTGPASQAPRSPFSVDVARRSLGPGVDGQGGALTGNLWGPLRWVFLPCVAGIERRATGRAGAGGLFLTLKTLVRTS